MKLFISVKSVRNPVSLFTQVTASSPDRHSKYVRLECEAGTIKLSFRRNYEKRIDAIVGVHATDLKAHSTANSFFKTRQSTNITKPKE